MNIELTKHAWEDFEYWVEMDISMVVKIKKLLRSINENPFKDLGKPEPRKHGLRGFWSRRITQEHRLVYKVTGKRRLNQKCSIVQCRFHYDDK